MTTLRRSASFDIASPPDGDGAATALGRLAVAPASRRRVLGAASSLLLAPLASLSFAGSRRKGGNRFVLVILRGGMDGLSAVPALGDADFAPARGPLGQFGAAPLPLDFTFALHPQLAELHATYARGEAAVIHAVGLPYYERSHFDAQQVLESGGARPYELGTGWLGRALGGSRGKGVALSTAVPLVLRGEAVVDTWAPSVLSNPSADLVARLQRMYAGDRPLATALERARLLHLEASSPLAAGDDAKAAMSGNAPRPGSFRGLAQRAAEFLADKSGPQVAVLELGGWDTHANQANPNGALVNALRVLDGGLATLRSALAASGTWERTVVVVASEFGREVAINGTLGTDHGSGGVAFVLGGAVRGGRVVADWPGLAKAQRFEGRDLRITTDLRAVLKGVLGDHLQIASKRLDGEVFPDSAAVKPLQLLRG